MPASSLLPPSWRLPSGAGLPVQEVSFHRLLAGGLQVASTVPPAHPAHMVRASPDLSHGQGDPKRPRPLGACRLSSASLHLPQLLPSSWFPV